MAFKINLNLDDDEAVEDFEPPEELPIEEKDLDLLGPPATRFWLDTLEECGCTPLPVVRDRLYHNMVVGRFITLIAAERYMRLREVGFRHEVARLRAGEAKQ